MKDVTKKLIDDFDIYNAGYDFMGCRIYGVYPSGSKLDFHHLLVPRRECVKKGMAFDGYVYENGVILKHGCSHEELHLIERYDYDKFCYITSEMQDMKVKGYLDLCNLKNINDILKEFEYEYENSCNKKGKRLIKRCYLDRIYK